MKKETEPTSNGERVGRMEKLRARLDALSPKSKNIVGVTFCIVLLIGIIYEIITIVQ